MIDFIKHIQTVIPEIIPYFHAMKGCQQDKTYHPEGDVWIHTKLVLEEFYNEWDLYTPKARKIMAYAIIFHDIGKPYCSEKIDGHIRSHGHSRIGYHIALELLDKALAAGDIEYDDMLEIANLVLFHGKPPWVSEKSTRDAEYEVIKLSQDCHIWLLWKLSTYDIKGRTAKDVPEMLEKVEYFMMLAEELNCLHLDYKFYNDYNKFGYLVKHNYHHTDQAYDDSKGHVYLMVGLPGTGKDTYIKENLSIWPIVSLDDIRAELKIKPTGNQGKVIQAAKEKAKVFMREGATFTWNATNTSKLIRDGLISLFTQYNYRIHIHYIHNTFDKILEQNKQREAQVPEKVIKKLFRNIDIPKNSEAHIVVHIDKTK